MNLHPDDLLFFNEVRTAMLLVASDYKLPLRSVEPMTMPEDGMADKLGFCTGSGNIAIVLRCTVDGAFVEEPISPAEVWDTAAHELAHLRHQNHGMDFQTFRLELLQAVRNQQEDYREKIIAKVVKMQAARDGEAALGNSEAAEAFATAINRMLNDHELSPSDIDYARGADRDPVIEIPVDLKKYNIETKKSRVAWQETLARVVAKAHLCTFLIRTGSNTIIFVGTKSHATVAEYAFGTLVPAAEKMSLAARHIYWREMRVKYNVPANKSISGIKEMFGFREAWLDSFIRRIGERFDEARSAAVAEAPIGSTQALIRLDGALIKTRKYIDDKFTSKRRVAALNSRGTNHSEGRERGRAAADQMAIGRKGVAGNSGPRGLLS